MPNIPSPVVNGRKVENDTIIPVLFDGPVSDEVLRELVALAEVVPATGCVELIVYCVLKFVLAKAMTNAKMK